MTGLVIVSSGHWSEANLTKATLCQISFQQLGHFGSLILIGGLLTFVFSTIIGWGYYGEKALEYLFGIQAILPYRWLWIIMVFLGAVWKSENVWNLSDIMNGLMALPNIASLLLLGGVLANETDRYFASRSKSSQSPSD
jgi:AGCS family alanine or glycine:cation symporter